MNGPPDIVGVPEFWPTAYEVNPAGFDAIYKLNVLFDKLRSKQVRGRLPATIGRLMTVCYKSLGAVTTLSFNGFGTDAMKVARSMFEKEVISDYLRKHPELADDYVDFIHVAVLQDYEYLLEKDPTALKRLPKELLKQVEADRTEPRFRDKKGKLKTTWKDKSIKKMAEETGRAEAYRTVYRWGSGLAHGDVTVLAAAFESEARDVDESPSNRWIHTALLVAHAAMLALMTDFNEEGKVGFDKEIQVARDEFEKAWDSEEK